MKKLLCTAICFCLNYYDEEMEGEVDSGWVYPFDVAVKRDSE